MKVGHATPLSLIGMPDLREVLSVFDAEDKVLRW
jgi:hypothetical protein